MTTASLGTPWMTVAQAARYMGRHPVTVRRYLEDGRMTGFQVTEPGGQWRIHRDDIDQFMRAPADRARRATPNRNPLGGKR